MPGMSTVLWAAIGAATIVHGHRINHQNKRALPVLPSTFDPAANTNLAVYWGQGAYQKRLKHFCEDSNIDIIPIGFLNQFPDQTGGYPGTNFGNQCGAETYDNPDGTPSLLLSNCPYIGPDIKFCQAMGKKILLSLGGGYPTNQHIMSIQSANDFADFLWRAFGPDNEPQGSTFPRPFGDAAVDGFDLDIESMVAPGEAPSNHYRDLVDRLRHHYQQESKPYYISGAPQCIVPDANLAEAIQHAQFDFLFLQFYNTPFCSARAYFDHTYGASNGAGDSDITFDKWVDFVHSARSTAKLFLGLPAAPAVPYDPAMYLQPAEAKEILEYFQCKYPDEFGGVMLYEATASEGNPIDGKPYADGLKIDLQKSTCARVPPPIASSSRPVILTGTAAPMKSGSDLPRLDWLDWLSDPAKWKRTDLTIYRGAKAFVGSKLGPFDMAKWKWTSFFAVYQRGKAFVYSKFRPFDTAKWKWTDLFPVYQRGKAFVYSKFRPFDTAKWKWTDLFAVYQRGEAFVCSKFRPFDTAKWKWTDLFAVHQRGEAFVCSKFRPFDTAKWKWTDLFPVYQRGKAFVCSKLRLPVFDGITGCASATFSFKTGETVHFPSTGGNVSVTMHTRSGATLTIPNTVTIAAAASPLSYTQVSSAAPHPSATFSSPSSGVLGLSSFPTMTTSSKTLSAFADSSLPVDTVKQTLPPNVPSSQEAPAWSRSIPAESPVSSVTSKPRSPTSTPLPPITEDVVTTEIVTSYITTIPVTQTAAFSGGSTVLQVNQTVSTIYRTIISTICTKCVAPPTAGPTASTEKLATGLIISTICTECVPAATNTLAPSSLGSHNLEQTQSANPATGASAVNSNPENSSTIKAPLPSQNSPAGQSSAQSGTSSGGLATSSQSSAQGQHAPGSTRPAQVPEESPVQGQGTPALSGQGAPSGGRQAAVTNSQPPNNDRPLLAPESAMPEIITVAQTVIPLPLHPTQTQDIPAAAISSSAVAPISPVDNGAAAVIQSEQPKIITIAQTVVPIPLHASQTEQPSSPSVLSSSSIAPLQVNNGAAADVHSQQPKIITIAQTVVPIPLHASQTEQPSSPSVPSSSSVAPFQVDNLAATEAQSKQPKIITVAQTVVPVPLSITQTEQASPSTPSSSTTAAPFPVNNGTAAGPTNIKGTVSSGIPPASTSPLAFTGTATTVRSGLFGVAAGLVASWMVL
ncbi:MAG: hypothetical protein Q9163_003684 [Psora crenata]